jgi:type IV pilus assembly protein PilM
MANIPEYFGIDLGDHTIKFVQLRLQNSQKAKLVAYHSIPTSVGVLYNDSEKGIETLATEIKKGYLSSKIKTRNCIISLPEVSIFSRLLTLPKVNEEVERSESIHWALKPLIPVSIEEVNISYLEIDTVKNEGVEMVNWYAVAAPKKLIEKFQAVISKAGLNLLAVETEALATTRAVQFNHNFQNKNVMILDLGAESTNIILARNGVVLFSQTISTGSNALTKVISSDFGIDMAQAEKYKVAYGVDPNQAEGKIAKSVEPVIQLVLGEVSRTLAYFKEKIGGSSIQTIYLTGGGAPLPYFSNYIAEKLSIETVVASALNNIEVDKSLKNTITPQNANGLIVGMGLGLKGITLQ